MGPAASWEDRFGRPGHRRRAGLGKHFRTQKASFESPGLWDLPGSGRCSAGRGSSGPRTRDEPITIGELARPWPIERWIVGFKHLRGGPDRVARFEVSDGG